ncbi:MAG: TonB family protein [Prochlorothrix sp.]|nr:TonB family protein [Prochlorothrix sp.]
MEMIYTGRRVVMYPQRRVFSPAELQKKHDRSRPLPLLLALSTVAQTVPFLWSFNQETPIIPIAEPTDRGTDWLPLVEVPPVALSPAQTLSQPEAHPLEASFAPEAATALDAAAVRARVPSAETSVPSASATVAASPQGSVARVVHTPAPPRPLSAQPDFSPSPRSSAVSQTPPDRSHLSAQSSAVKAVPIKPIAGKPAESAPPIAPSAADTFEAWGDPEQVTQSPGQSPGQSPALARASTAPTDQSNPNASNSANFSGSGPGEPATSSGGAGGPGRSGFRATAPVTDLPQQPWPFAVPSSVPASSAANAGSSGSRASQPRTPGRGELGSSGNASSSNASSRNASSSHADSRRANPSHASSSPSGSRHADRAAVAPSAGTPGNASPSARPASALPRSSTPSQAAPTTPQFDLTPYLQNVKEQVDRQWSSHRQRSRVVVFFRIGRSGELGEIRLTQPSGDAQANAAALAAVRHAASSFGPIPAAYVPDSVSVSLTLIQD